MKDDDKAFAEGIREIEKGGKASKPHPNYGIISTAMMALTICSFMYGFQRLSNGLMCAFAGPFTGKSAQPAEIDAKTGLLLVIFSFILLVISLAIAGAAVATECGGFLGLFVIIGSIAPFGLALYVTLFGVPADVMSSVSPPASSTVTILPSGSSMEMNPASKC